MPLKLFSFLRRRPDVDTRKEAASMPATDQPDAAIHDLALSDIVEPAPEPAEQTVASVSPPLVFDLTVHLAGIGDQKAAEDGWGGRKTGQNRIEGFVVKCDLPAWREHVTFQAVQRDQSLSDPVAGGVYCGTRGKAIPLHGFVMQVPEEAAAFAGICYQGVFADGFSSALLSPGDLCVSPSHAALLAMRIADRDPAAAVA